MQANIDANIRTVGDHYDRLFDLVGWART